MLAPLPCGSRPRVLASPPSEGEVRAGGGCGDVAQVEQEMAGEEQGDAGERRCRSGWACSKGCCHWGAEVRGCDCNVTASK